MQPQQRPGAPGGISWARLTQGQRILAIANLVLLISLFLPWRNLLRGLEAFGVSGNVSALANPLSYLVLLLILGWYVFEGLVLGGAIRGNFNPALISAAIAGATALFALVLFLTSLSGVTWGAFIGLLAALAVGWGAWMRFQESKATAPPPSAAPPTAPPPAR